MSHLDGRLLLLSHQMNLASRCREAITQAAGLKKELSQQKKKTAEAVSQTVAVIEQLKKMQKQHKKASSSSAKNKNSNNAPASPTSACSPTQSPTQSESSDVVVVLEAGAVAPLLPLKEESEKAPELPIAVAAATPVQQPKDAAVVTDSSSSSNEMTVTPQSTTTAKDEEPSPTPVTAEKTKQERDTKGLTADDVLQDMEEEEDLAQEEDDEGSIVTVESTTTPPAATTTAASTDTTTESEISDANVVALYQELPSAPSTPDTRGLVSSDDYEDVSTASPAKKSRSIKDKPTPITLEPEGAKDESEERPIIPVVADPVAKAPTTVDVPKEEEERKEGPIPVVVDPVAEVTAAAFVPKKDEKTQAVAPVVDVDPVAKVSSAAVPKEEETATDDSPVKMKAEKVPMSMSEELASMVKESKEDSWNEDYDEAAETEDIITGLAESPVKKSYFPESASPIIQRYHRTAKQSPSSRLAGGYNEGMPSDMIRQPALSHHRKVAGGGGSKLGNFVEEDSNEALPSSNLLSSIDAFEASFNTSFPESFSPKEDESTTTTAPASKSVDKSIKDTSIYNPFESDSPSKSLPPRDDDSTKSEESEGKSGGRWGLQRVRDRVAYLRANSRSGKRPPGKDEPQSPSRSDVKPTASPIYAEMIDPSRSGVKPTAPPIKAETIDPSESIISISKTPEKMSEASESILSISKSPEPPKKEMTLAKMTSSSLSASSYRNKHSNSKSPPDNQPPPPPPPVKEERFERFIPKASTPTKVVDLDRFSTPIAKAPPARPEKSSGYDEARQRYESALGRRSTEKTKSSSTRSSDPSVRSSAGASIASVESSSSTLRADAFRTRTGTSVRERAILFSSPNGSNASPSSWDEGDIPMRSSLSPQKRYSGPRKEAASYTSNVSSYTASPSAWRQKDVSPAAKLEDRRSPSRYSTSSLRRNGERPIDDGLGATPVAKGTGINREL